MRFHVTLILAVWTCLASIATAAPSTQPTLDVKCQMLLDRWRPRLDREKFGYLVSAPFVIAGDGGLARLKRYEVLTIRAAADALQKEFFDAKPSEPILILLFESEEPYRRLAKDWLGDKQVSPYGYFRHDNIMVMNVGTGTGTLVHELTHALIKPDFPDVPDWFNEGLGSLFEQCTLEGGKIRGLPNWRLAALQHALQRETAPRSLTDLIADDHFYADEHVGLNYAMARYLLLYLQDQNKLAAFYKDLRAHHADDPTGLETLKKTITPQSMREFEIDWQAWVLKLRFGQGS
jgi:hypothetical protein